MTPTVLTFGTLVIQALLVLTALFALFQRRGRWGLMPLAAFVGSNQYLQSILASTHYVRIADIQFSPGSVILFPSTLVAILLIYYKEGVPEARSLIRGVVIANITLNFMAYLTAWQLRLAEVENLLGVPSALFQVDPRIFLVGTLVLVLDSILIVVLFEVIAKNLAWLPQVIQFPINLIAVLAFDAVAFTVLAFGDRADLGTLLSGQLIAKTFGGAFFAVALVAYFRFVDPGRSEEAELATGTGALAILTFRERYEILKEHHAHREEFHRRQHEESQEALVEAEQRYRTLFRSMHDGLLIIEDLDRILDCNAALLEMSGQKREDLIGHPLSKVGLFDESLFQEQSTIHSAKFQSRLLRQEQSPLEIDLTITRFGVGTGSAVAFLIHDASKKRAAERRLRRSRDRFREEAEQRSTQLRERDATLAEIEFRYRDLFENTHDLIQVADPEGRLLLVNQAWCEGLGYTPEQSQSLTINDVIGAQSRQRWEECTSQLRAGAATSLIELEFMRSDGSLLPVEGNINGAFQDDHLTLTRSIFRDVSIRREVDKLKDGFIATVSHELRTPLTSIHGSLDLIWRGKAGEIPEKSHRFVGIALRNSERLLGLVNQILDLQQLKSGSWPLRPERVTPEVVVDQVLEENQGLSSHLGVELSYQVSSHDQVTIEVDPEALKMVLANLISNALKYSPSGGQVTVTTQSKGDTFLFRVIDQGPGVPLEKRSQIFQPFVQLGGESQAQSLASSGLGLSIARELTESMHGGIGLEEDVEQGSVFFVEFPCTQESAANRSAAGQKEEPSWPES